MSLELTKLNSQIRNVTIADETPPANPIGFVYTPPEEEYEDDEEEE